MFDKAHFNTNTIDRITAFHSMGGTIFVYPFDCLEKALPMKRRKAPVTTKEICQTEQIPLLMYSNMKKEIKIYTDQTAILEFDHDNLAKGNVL